MENLDNYLDIYNDLIKNFDIRKRNYSILQNINDLMKNNNIFMTNVTEIINDNNLKTKFNSLIDMANKMSFKDKEKEETGNIITEFIKEDNIVNDYKKGNDKNKEEVNNNDNITKNSNFNNFQISKIKELKKFLTKYEIEDIMVLNDGRILSYQKYCNENGDELYKLFIYNIKNDAIICDINYDVEEILSIFQMDDNNIIISNYNKIKLLKIKEKSIEENQIKIDKYFDKIYKLTNNRIILKYYDMDTQNEKFEIYLYEKGNLVVLKINFGIEKEYIFNDLCEINQNEISIYC